MVPSLFKKHDSEKVKALGAKYDPAFAAIEAWSFEDVEIFKTWSERCDRELSEESGKSLTQDQHQHKDLDDSPRYYLSFLVSLFFLQARG